MKCHIILCRVIRFVSYICEVIFLKVNYVITSVVCLLIVLCLKFVDMYEIYSSTHDTINDLIWLDMADKLS